MKFDKKIVVIIIGSVGLYAFFLFLSDITILSKKSIDFKFEFLPVIFLLVTCSWIPVYIRWSLLLQNVNVKIPTKQNIAIFLSALALGMTPGKIGELIRSQLLKTKFGISRTKTAPLVYVEKLYDLVGAIIISISSLWFFPEAGYIIVVGIILLVIVFILIRNRNLFYKFSNLLFKFKKAEKFFGPILQSYEVIKNSTRGKIAIFASLLSISHWLIISLAVYFVLLAFGINNLNFLAVVTTYTTAIILGVMSFLPAGIGVAEGSLVGLLSIQGLEISTTLVLVILIRFFTLWYAVIVGLVTMKLINH